MWKCSRPFRRSVEESFSEKEVPGMGWGWGENKMRDMMNPVR